jgi:hypothetical protein
LVPQPQVWHPQPVVVLRLVRLPPPERYHASPAEPTPETSRLLKKSQKGTLRRQTSKWKEIALESFKEFYIA